MVSGNHCSCDIPGVPLEESSCESLLDNISSGLIIAQIYIFAQILGGLVGAALTYANYFHAIDLVEGPGVRTLATAGLFSTYAVSTSSRPQVDVGPYHP